MFDALKELLLEKPDRQLDELAAFLRDEFDVEVSISTISHTLKAEG
jgi:transposase